MLKATRAEPASSRLRSGRFATRGRATVAAEFVSENVSRSKAAFGANVPSESGKFAAGGRAAVAVEFAYGSMPRGRATLAVNFPSGSVSFTVGGREAVLAKRIKELPTGRRGAGRKIGS